MLTHKQHQLLMLIRDHLNERGVPPSFDEMKESIGLKSKSGVHRLITGLEERGFIRRLAHRARAIEILRLPNDLEPDGSVKPAQVTSPSHHNIVPFPNKNKFDEIPLYGRIAAGLPIQAVADENNFLTVPSYLLGNGEYYALEVDGDSMIEKGIHDGDTVIIQRGSHANDGDVIVALVNDEEVTLKTCRFSRDGRIGLEPANVDYQTRYFSPGEVQVQGKLASLIRRYPQ